MFTIYDLNHKVNIDGPVRLRIYKDGSWDEDEIFSKDYEDMYDLYEDEFENPIVRYAYENFELSYVFASTDGYLTFDTILPADFPDKRALANLGESKRDGDGVTELEETKRLKESYDTDGKWLSDLDYNTINKLMHTPATYGWGTLFEDQEELDEFIRRCDELNIKITLLPDINSQYQDTEVQCTLAQLVKLYEASDVDELISMYDIEVFY